MQVLVNPDFHVALVDAGNFKAFDIRVEGDSDPARLTKALHGIAELEGEQHAWVDESWLLEQLARHAPAHDWREAFDAMTTYARTKGWVRDNPTAIRAHLVSVD